MEEDSSSARSVLNFHEFRPRLILRRTVRASLVTLVLVADKLKKVVFNLLLSNFLVLTLVSNPGNVLVRRV